MGKTRNTVKFEDLQTDSILEKKIKIIRIDGDHTWKECAKTLI